MNESDLRRSLAKIRPPQSLIDRTCAQLVQRPREKIPFRMTRALPALCAGLLLLMLTGISLTMLKSPTVIVGTFSPQAGYVPAESVVSSQPAPMMARILPAEPEKVSFVEQPYDEEEYLALFRQAVSDEEQVLLVADAMVESGQLYLHTGDEDVPEGLYFMQIRLTGVEEISDNARQRCREGDSISAAVWLNTSPEAIVLPEEGQTYRFCLFTGIEGDPLDTASREAELKQTWMLYGSYRTH